MVFVDEGLGVKFISEMSYSPIPSPCFFNEQKGDGDGEKAVLVP